jgi:hypothetical protein
MIFMCPIHGKSGSVKIGNLLKEAIDQNTKVEYLVGLEYYFDYGGSDSRIGFYFSPDEADIYKIKKPGVKIIFGPDIKDEAEDPFQTATKNTTVICSKCFHDIYSSELSELEDVYKNNGYNLIEL